MAFLLSTVSLEATSKQYLSAARFLGMETKKHKEHYSRQSEAGVEQLAGQP